jgi:hypothetical protein
LDKPWLDHPKFSGGFDDRLLHEPISAGSVVYAAGARAVGVGGRHHFHEMGEHARAKRLGLESARVHLSRYAEAVVREEWANGNTKPSSSAEQELAQLRQELIRASDRVPTALGNHFWRVFDDVVKARSGHLWIAQEGHSEQSWALVLVLGLLSHIAIGFVHADPPPDGKLAMALFACATTSSYWLLTRAINPFARLDASYYLKAISGAGL